MIVMFGEKFKILLLSPFKTSQKCVESRAYVRARMFLILKLMRIAFLFASV